MKMYTPSQGTNISPKKLAFWVDDDFPIPKGGIC